jgi:VanZ family protein
MAKKTLVWVIAEVVIIFILLSLPGSSFHKTANWFGPLPIDKIVHIGLFGSLAFSLFYHFEKLKAERHKTVRTKAFILISCMLYGIAMEYYQKYFVPSRGFEVADMLADTIGAILALPIFTWLNKKSVIKRH